VAVGQLEQFAPVVQRQHGARRIAGGAQVQQLHARPHVGRHAGVIAGEVAGRLRVHEIRLGARQVGRAFVDLVERIRADDERARLRRIDHAVRDREQRLARTVHGQHHRGRIQRRNRVAALQPAGDRGAQGLAAVRGRIRGQAGHGVRQGFLDERGRRVLRFADAQADGLEVGIRRHAGEQLAQLFERIGMQAVEMWIHGDVFSWRYSV
jgi:hypothetical protein